MGNKVEVFIESGNKKVFANALTWPGWSRSGRSVETALQALLDTAPRMAALFEHSPLSFEPPTSIDDFVIADQVTGNTGTDFGAPSVMIDADIVPLSGEELARQTAVLQAYWHAFDQAIKKATGKELRKGPRGGGRDLEKIIEHVVTSDQSYLRRIAAKFKIEAEVPLVDQLPRLRQTILTAVETAVSQGLPEKGPRGGKIWPLRLYIRYSAWHILDHSWEIEDRIL